MSLQGAGIEILIFGCYLSLDINVFLGGLWHVINSSISIHIFLDFPIRLVRAYFLVIYLTVTTRKFIILTRNL